MPDFPVDLFGVRRKGNFSIFRIDRFALQSSFQTQEAAMRKLILEEWVSLDGYVSDKNGQLDFFTSLTPEQNKYSDQDQLKFLETVDTILLGRKTYELFVDFWPTATVDKEVIADKLNETSK